MNSTEFVWHYRLIRSKRVNNSNDHSFVLSKQLLYFRVHRYDANVLYRDKKYECHKMEMRFQLDRYIMYDRVKDFNIILHIDISYRPNTLMHGLVTSYR